MADLVTAAGHELCGFVDRDPTKVGAEVPATGAEVLYLQEEFLSLIGHGRRLPNGIDACALAIGDNPQRKRCLDILGDFDVPVLVHPTATLSPWADLGRGTVVLAHAVVNAGARIGEGSILNTGSIVEHDCVLGKAVHVSPGAILCGAVQVGECSWIGAGATISPGLTIGQYAIVGAGSTVIRDVSEHDAVVGSPAHTISPKQAKALERSGAE